MNTTTHSVFARAPRTVILTSADLSFRQRLRDALIDLRWQVVEATGGAETLACLARAAAETVVLDSWLPDLEIQEFIAEFRRLHPDVDLVLADASDAPGPTTRGPRRNEVLLALRRAQSDGAIWNSAPHLMGERYGLATPSQRFPLDQGSQQLSGTVDRVPGCDNKVLRGGPVAGICRVASCDARSQSPGPSGGAAEDDGAH